MRAIKLLFNHILFVLMIAKSLVSSTPVTNSLSENLRDYSVKENDDNSTTVRTLQKENLGRYANFAPIRNPIRFKEVPDNALSGSSYARGLLHHDHSGYGHGLHDYDDGPHQGYGYEYHIHDDHHDGYHLSDHHDHHHDHDHHDHHHDHDHHDHHHDHDHHDHHGGHHHVGYGHGHHHKHYDHALAAKAVLWPIAGIAILGAAAALVSNPVLLQLGVISGKRKRRDTEASHYGANLDVEPLKKWPKADDERCKIYVDEGQQKRDGFFGKLKKRTIKEERQKVLSPKEYPTGQSSIETVTLNAHRDNEDSNEKIFVPIPLILKTSNKGVKKD